MLTDHEIILVLQLLLLCLQLLYFVLQSSKVLQFLLVHTHSDLSLSRIIILLIEVVYLVLELLYLLILLLTRIVKLLL